MAKFSRGHYELIAQAIVKARLEDGLWEHQVVVDRVAYHLSEALARDNSQFDRIKFMDTVRGFRKSRLPQG